MNDEKELTTCADLTHVQETATHGIAFYKDMIFDANNEGTKKATMKNIDAYTNFPCVEKNPTKITIPLKITK